MKRRPTLQDVMQDRPVCPPEVLALLRDMKRYVEDNGFGSEQTELIERAETLLRKHTV
jgi:hypothetical protein